MGYNNWVTPKEAAGILGMSVASISRARKDGAPFHPWGPAGRNYLIDIPAFVAWMGARGQEPEKKPVKKANHSPDARTMMEQRHAHIAMLAEEARA